MIIVFIHWDAEHTSPPIGLFRTQRDADAFKRDFRKLWKKTNDRRPVNGKPCPRLETKLMRTPEEAVHWAGR